MKLADKIGKNIKYYRELNNLSQKELANRCLTVSSWISHFECGRRVPSIKTLIRIANALECKIYNLIPENYQ